MQKIKTQYFLIYGLCQDFTYIEVFISYSDLLSFMDINFLNEYRDDFIIIKGEELSFTKEQLMKN